MEAFHKALLNFTFFAATFDPEPQQDDFTWLTKMTLSTGDVLVRKNKSSRMYKEILDGSYQNVFQHCALVFNSTHVYQMIVPKARILPLNKFMSRSESITVLKLKIPGQEMRQRLREMMERTVGIKYGLMEHLDICTMQHYIHYLKVFRPHWRYEIDRRIHSFLKGKKDFVTCSDTIMTMMMAVAPDLKMAIIRCKPFLALFKYGIFRPDDFIVRNSNLQILATFNPSLFEIVNPPSSKEDRNLMNVMTSTSVMQESMAFGDHENLHTLRKQASFTLEVAWHLGKLANSPNVEHQYQIAFARVQPQLLKVAEGVISLANNEGQTTSRVEESDQLNDLFEKVIPDLNDPHPDKCKKRFIETPGNGQPEPKL